MGGGGGGGGGGDGGGAPVTGPGERPEDTPGDDDSDSEKKEPEDSEDDNGQNDDSSDGQDPTESVPEDESVDEDSEREEQEGDQQNRDGESEEDREHEKDEEDAEDNDEDDEDEDEDDEDECLIAETALLHSPNIEPLGDATEGDIYSVRLQDEAVCVVDSQDRTIGAIAEPWVGTLKECIEQGRQYRARILEIDGGKCEVRVTNRCLLYRDLDLIAINAAVRDQLHPGLSLSVETTTEEGVVVMNDGSRVGDVPNPWAQLLNECIEKGRSYQAEVRSITPESCTVNIQSVPGDE
ncbi:hypothetical protein [Halorhabdus rudnickae]|uniref:hypothetical protein n=1 Tax=Halorhabdus rudnickae TaxID=1775544 RepID=UPI0014385D0F|nr:hypothetical protein [Halorhabdus rudnickae]